MLLVYNNFIGKAFLPSLRAAKGGRSSVASTGWVNSARDINASALT
jgi:hypothetical protein